MRIELENEKKQESVEALKNKVDSRSGVSDEIKEQKAKFRELSFKKKVEYIYDYYKWFIIIGIVVIIFGTVFVRDYRENLKPTYINALLLNSYFAYDNTNTVEQDFINQYGINTDEYKIYIDTGISLSEEAFDTTMLANQQKIVSMYSAEELDVVIGPVETMEGSADCNGYANLGDILPKELLDELADRDYEFYYYTPTFVDELEGIYEQEEPYFAGIYLDNCSYLNNNGEYGAYPVATSKKDRPIFTIAANSHNVDHAIEFLEFLVQNR